MSRTLAAILLLTTLSMRAVAVMLHPGGVLCIPQAESCHVGKVTTGHEACCPREVAASVVSLACAIPCHDDCNGCLNVDLPHEPMRADGAIDAPRLVKADASCLPAWVLVASPPESPAASRLIRETSHAGCLHAPIVRATRLLI